MLGPIRVSSMLAALIVIALLPLLIFLRVREHRLMLAGRISENTLPSVSFLLTNGENSLFKAKETTENTTAEEPSAESEDNQNG